MGPAAGRSGFPDIFPVGVSVIQELLSHYNWLQKKKKEIKIFLPGSSKALL